MGPLTIKGPGGKCRALSALLLSSSNRLARFSTYCFYVEKLKYSGDFVKIFVHRRRTESRPAQNLYTRSLLARQTVFFQLVLQIAATDAEQFGGLGLNAPSLQQGLVDQCGFDFVE